MYCSATCWLCCGVLATVCGSAHARRHRTPPGRLPMPWPDAVPPAPDGAASPAPGPRDAAALLMAPHAPSATVSASDGPPCQVPQEPPPPPWPAAPACPVVESPPPNSICCRSLKSSAPRHPPAGCIHPPRQVRGSSGAHPACGDASICCIIRFRISLIRWRLASSGRRRRFRRTAWIAAVRHGSRACVKRC